MPKHIGYETARDQLARGCYQCANADVRKLGCGNCCTLAGRAPAWDAVSRQCSSLSLLPQKQNGTQAPEGKR